MKIGTQQKLKAIILILKCSSVVMIQYDEKYKHYTISLQNKL